MNANCTTRRSRRVRTLLIAATATLGISTARADLRTPDWVLNPPLSHPCPVPADQYDLCTTSLMPFARVTVSDSTLASLGRSFKGRYSFVHGDPSSLGIVSVHIEKYLPTLCSPIDQDVQVAPGDAEPPRLKGQHCTHGAELLLWLTNPPELEQSESWMWLQIAQDRGTFCLRPRNDGRAYLDSDNGTPFYYSDEEIRAFTSPAWNRPQTWFFDAAEDGCFFRELVCGGACPAPDHWSIGFSLVLTKFNSATSTVTVFDGIHWGFQADCVPEPGTVALMFAGLGLLTWRIRVHH